MWDSVCRWNKSDGHSVEDMSIMPIEELTSNDRVSGTSQERITGVGNFFTIRMAWMNVCGVGNIKTAWISGFNKRQRKFRKRNSRKRRRKIWFNFTPWGLLVCLISLMFNVILSLPIWTSFQVWTSQHEIPDRVVINEGYDCVQEESLAYRD